MDLIILLSVVGSVASIIGVFLAAPTARSRVIHAVYGLAISVLAGGLVYYWQQTSAAEDFEVQAMKILRNTDEADDRATMLATLALLEKHKAEFPETYSAARELCVQTGMLGSVPSNTSLSPIDGAHAMRGLLYGLSRPPSDFY